MVYCRRVREVAGQVRRLRALEMCLFLCYLLKKVLLFYQPIDGITYVDPAEVSGGIGATVESFVDLRTLYFSV